MRRHHVFIALLASVIIPITGLMAAAPAIAYNVGAVYKDCETNGHLTGHYSSGELQAALNGMPSVMAEYSDCQDVIQRALLAASTPTGRRTGSTTTGGGGGGGGSGSGSGSGKTPGGKPGGKTGGHGKRGSTRTGVNSAPKAAAAGKGRASGITLAGANIRPGSTGTSVSARSLPAALLVVLILLALAAVSGGAVAIRRRVVARHGT
jgi:hypothetical protein